MLSSSLSAGSRRTKPASAYQTDGPTVASSAYV
jgi:hypothetical protein